MWTDALVGFRGLVTGRRNHVAATGWDLAKDGTLRLTPPRGGMVVTAASGSLVVTQEGDPEDHVLAPGEHLRLAGRGLVVAWALTPARVAVR